MQEEKKLLSNTLFFFLDWVSVSLLSFIFWVFLAKTLPKEDLGIVSTSANFVILLSTFTMLGINSALSKLIPEAMRKKKIKEVSSLVKISFKTVFISVTALMFFLFLFVPQLSSVFKLPKDAMNISIISLFFFSFFNFFGSILYGLQKIKRIFLTDTLSISIKLLFSFVLVVLGMNYLGPLIGFCLCYIIAMLFRVETNLFKNVSSAYSFRKVFYYAFPAFITSIAGSVIIYSQYMILSSLQNPGVTGLYTVAFTVSGVLIAIVSVFSSALFPIVSELSSVSKARERQSYFITIVFRYALFLIIPISSLLLVFSNYVVLLLSEPSKIAAASFLPVLIPASVLFGLGGIFFASIYAIGKPKLQRNIILLVTILFLVLSVPLTIHYSALGLSVSYLISSFCYFILSYGFLYKHLKFKLYTKDILKIIFSSVLTVSFLFILKPFVHDIFTLFIVSIPMTLFYLVFLLLIKFYRIEDARLLRFFGRRIPGGKYLIALAGIIEKVTE